MFCGANDQEFQPEYTLHGCQFPLIVDHKQAQALSWQTTFPVKRRANYMFTIDIF